MLLQVGVERVDVCVLAVGGLQLGLGRVIQSADQLGTVPLLHFVVDVVVVEFGRLFAVL